ncbi:hypothetical protein HX13_17685 [Chryseobacterium sp. P1-3]|uniref:hypothetical protein n=1 Tax=Chryseobacterium sp. (strain P1-3) TaxID=1517683 RepID=UPI0004E60566|nr:hypothetical protein [Chryseobacterium sp. P1-3]KFF73831.1 hypothetical protein HX13_17685 [Chryseobacterium sp. P1-3]
MKVCKVYKKKKEYKIVTGYQVDVGRYVYSSPVFILPILASLDEVSDCLFRSLKESREITYEEYNTGFSPKELLKEMKESSFPKLYKDSTSCMVYLKGDIIEIVPYRREPPEQGLFPVTSEMVTIPYTNDNELAITDEILKVVSAEY